MGLMRCGACPDMYDEDELWYLHGSWYCWYCYNDILDAGE